MNPEDQSWQRLREHAAAQLSPGFADRVMRAAHAAKAAAPSLFGQIMLSAATAALCFTAVAVFHGARTTDRQDETDWQQISATADDSGPGL